ncbi:hypothetical protein ACFQZV_08380 [Microbacterium koreense]|uniref:Uncharacterized protein n=1 Tax=Microbacterium koreense TaxID=323761 RepID=A0ABW2ZRP7_9MICO
MSTSLDLRTSPPDAVAFDPADLRSSHLTFVDRLSLRVGFWLLLRGARRARQRRTDHTTQAERVSTARTLATREYATVRLHQLGPRP